MSAAADRVVARYRLQPASGRPIAWWGVILLSTTEAVLFSVLLVSYAYLWSVADRWPPAGVEPPELLVSGIRSVLLFATSGTVVLAERALDRTDRRRAVGWLVATVALASVFLAGHVDEMRKLPHEFTWSDHAYGAIYYTVVNFHAAHLAVGLLVFLFLIVRLARGAFGPDHATQLSTGGIYWHFVDVVWLFVYSTLYLAPNLFGSGG